MESVYTVGVDIALHGSTGKIIQKLAAEFAKLDEIASGFNKTLSSTNSAMRLLSESSKTLAGTWRGLANDAERFTRAARAAGGSGRSGGTGGPGEPSATGALARIPYVPNFTTKGGPYDPTRRASPNLPVPYEPKGYELPHDEPFEEPYRRQIPLNYRAPGAEREPRQGGGFPRPDMLATGVGGYGGYKVGQTLFDAGAEVDHLKSELLKQGLSPEQVGQAYAKAIATQQQVKPSSLTGNLGIVSSLMAVLQDPTAAISLMPDYSKAAAVLNSSGHGEELGGLMQAIRSGEFRGAAFTRLVTSAAKSADSLRSSSSLGLPAKRLRSIFLAISAIFAFCFSVCALASVSSV